MTERFDLLTQELFQKNISDCSWEEIRDFASSYPYFAPAQYILAKKSKLEYVPAGNAGQAAKAILYYHNPLAFDFFLHPEKYETGFPRNETPATALAIATATEAIDKTRPGEVVEERSVSRSAYLPAEQENIIEPGEEPAEESKPVTDEPPLEINKTTAPILQAESIDESLLFEPFHTVDYFASQGINISLDAATKDQMGKQLKSFTEWLKTMKREPVAEQEKKIDPVTEKKVATLAAHSLESTSIITEAMAEVWAMQGNREKAIEIYHKLSSLHPSKKAYFAAKVEKLTKRQS